MNDYSNNKIYENNKILFSIKAIYYPFIIIMLLSFSIFSEESYGLENKGFVYPILFVHGYSGDASSWDNVKEMLNKKHFEFGGHFDLRTSLKDVLIEEKYDKLKAYIFKPADFYTISLSDNNDLDFIEQAYEVAIVIKAIKKLNNSKKVIIVGHSMGGLASRAYIQSTDMFRNDVHALVTMSTPHLGSFLAHAYNKIAIESQDEKGLSTKMRESKYKFIKRYAEYLEQEGISDDNFPEYRKNLLISLGMVFGIMNGINPSAKATQYLQPHSKQLKELNKSDISMEIDYINVISHWDMDKEKEKYLKILDFCLKSYDTLKFLNDGVALTGLNPFLLKNSKLIFSWLNNKYREKKLFKWEDLRIALKYIYEELNNDTTNVSDIYHALICDFLEFCKSDYFLTKFSDKLKIKYSDGVVSIPSQMIELFPLSRKKITKKDLDLSKRLSQKVEKQFTDLFHIDVNKKKPEIVTWAAIKKYEKEKRSLEHIVFVIDSSGSMKKTDPNRVRIKGLTMLLNRLDEDKNISIVDFDHQAKVKAQHLNVREKLHNLISAIDTIDANGNTHIGKGLLKAISIAEKYNESSIIFLLTDGRNNGKEDVLSIAKGVSGTLPIFTVGLTGAVNEQLLSKIADTTNGRYFKASSSRELFAKINTLLSEANKEVTLLSSFDRIMRGEIQEKIFTVDRFIRRMSIILSWSGSRIDLEIVKPNRQVITEKNANEFGIRYLKDANTIIVVSEKAEPGDWKLRLIGSDIPSNGEKYSYSVQALSGFRPQIKIGNLYSVGSNISLNLSIINDKVANYDSLITVEDPKGKRYEIMDGKGFRPLIEGDYKVICSISGNLDDGQKFQRIIRKEFHVSQTNLEDLKYFLIKDIGMLMRKIPTGSFIMGDNTGKIEERPAHKVIISKEFWMAESETTQYMWKKIMGDNPAIFKSGDHYPIENVSYDDVQLFLKKLSKLIGMKCRLPTEAEWEYACRTGTNTSFSWGNDVLSDHVRINDEWSLGHSPVKMFSPNRWGLFDMHSNVWEWCSDWFDAASYTKSHRRDPVGPKNGIFRVARGGAWSYGTDDMRSAKRTAILPSRQLGNLGFRFIIDRRK